MALKDWLDACLNLFYPKVCAVCSQPLSGQEECICFRCGMSLPRTNLHLKTENAAEQLFWGKVDVERVSAYFYYQRGSDFREILHRLKYKGEKEIGEVMGRQMAAELSAANFFDGVDYLLPVPLHKKKQRRRGYNQSEYIARGVSAATGIPIAEGAVTRERHTETQTRKSVMERWENVDGIFKLHTPELFAGKHILLIDDVLTTGATCVACADAVTSVENVKVSVLTLAMAQ